MKTGDCVKLVGIPPNLKDAEDLPTRTLFEKCLGRTLVIAEMQTFDGVPIPLARLDVGHLMGQEPWKHTIWVEPEYLQIVDPYRVFVILDREYGTRLFELAVKEPVWIVDTPTNRHAAQEIWAADTNRSHLAGVTTFKVGSDCSPEEELIGELETVDLHHGVYSANPPYTIVEVIGANISERIKKEFSRFGFDQFEATPQGFRAVRPLPSNWTDERWSEE